MEIESFISLILPPVRRYIGDVRSTESDNTPPNSIIVEVEMTDKENSTFGKSFSYDTRMVSHPSKKDRHHPSEDYFSDAAETIVDHPKIGRSFPLPEDMDDRPLEFDPEISRWEQKLFEFSWKVMDYEGEFNFSEQAFFAALSDQLLLSEESTFTVIVPLLNVNSVADEIPLTVEESDVKPHENNRFVIQNLRIERFTNPELSAIFTYEGYLSDPSQELYGTSGLSFNHPSHKLLIEYDSVYSANFGLRSTSMDSDIIARPLLEKSREISERVVAAMRLDSPSTRPDIGQCYILNPDWRTYRDDINSIDLHRPWMSGYEPRLWGQKKRGSSYSINEREFQRVQRFWDRYSYHISFSEQSPFDRPLSRYNEIYDRSSPKDRLVDAVIIFEGLLTKGCDIGGLGTTLRLIGSLLLDQRANLSRSELRMFFTNLYLARGEIVHNDATWEEITSSNNFEYIEHEPPSINEFENKTRKLVAQTILSYMDQQIENGRSIGRTNMRIYDSMRNATESKLSLSNQCTQKSNKDNSYPENTPVQLNWLGFT